jgi:putative ABC transport system permease protein
VRTPLAWNNLTSSLGKCALAATGVGFAVVLMFMQIGFRNALIDNNVQLFTLFDVRYANLAMVSQARYNLSTAQRFPRILVDQALAMPEVESVCCVSVERSTAKVQVAGFRARPIRVIGVQLHNGQFFRDASLYMRLVAANAELGGLVDVRSVAAYGFATDVEQLRQQRIELNKRRLNIVGQFELGTDFANDGSLLMSERLHGNYFPWRSATRVPSDVVDIALLHVPNASGPELKRLAEQLTAISPEQLDVRPTQQFITREKEFWSRATPIGKIFAIGTLMGLVVGAIICYQIQFTDISEHMPEFATLKAMGYSNGYFWRLVLCQSFYLACLGFLPGLLVSYGLYAVLADVSGLVMSMTWDRILLVWGLTLGMCLVSGLLAIRKLFSTDPASLF